MLFLIISNDLQKLSDNLKVHLEVFNFSDVNWDTAYRPKNQQEIIADQDVEESFDDDVELF